MTPRSPIIENSAYTIFPKPPNPRHDAEDLDAVLKEVGFDVLLGLDLKRAGIEECSSSLRAKHGFLTPR